MLVAGHGRSGCLSDPILLPSPRSWFGRMLLKLSEPRFQFCDVLAKLDPDAGVEDQLSFDDRKLTRDGVAKDIVIALGVLDDGRLLGGDMLEGLTDRREVALGEKAGPLIAAYHCAMFGQSL